MLQNVGSLLPQITLPTSPLPEGTFPAPEMEVSPTKRGGERQVLERDLRMSQVRSSMQVLLELQLE